MKKIPLTQGRFAIVDDKDFGLVNQHKWHARKGWNTYYAQAHIRKPDGKRITLRMHRLILKPPNGLDSDHRDGDGLNNQRYNLRACTRSQNAQNRCLQGGTSKYKGVSWHKQCKKWYARIQINGKNLNLGYFTDEIEAAKCYDRNAEELFGEFAHLNFQNKGNTK